MDFFAASRGAGLIYSPYHPFDNFMSTQKRSLLQSFVIVNRYSRFKRDWITERVGALRGSGCVGVVYDSFIVAWTFPGVIRRFVADEGLTGALMPAVGNAETESLSEAKRLASQALGALIVVCILLSVGGILAAPALVHWMAPSFSGEQLDLTVSLSQVLFPFVLFVSILS